MSGPDPDDDEDLDDASAEDVSPGPEQPLDIGGYRLLRELTRGSQGIIFLAQQKSTGRRVALKLLFHGEESSPRQRERMDREVRILAALDHPNIISVIDRGETADGSAYFVMNYVDGRMLNEFLDDYRRDHGAPEAATDLKDLLRLFRRICDAVNAAHLRGVVHRDLKPANILVDAYGEPHILDFGLAHAALAPDEDEPAREEFVGSIEWASPEQAEGDETKIDTRTDVYALGVILYELLTGEFPYDVFGPMPEVLEQIRLTRPLPPGEVLAKARAEQHLAPAENPPVDATLDALVLKALAKSRDDRFQTAGELARELGAYLEKRREDKALPVPAPPAAPPPERKHPRLLVLGGAGLLLLLLLAAAFLWARPKQPPRELVPAYDQGVYGFAVDEDDVCFVFDPARYDTVRREDGQLEKMGTLGRVERVSVAGDFNDWKAERPEWRMQSAGPGRFVLHKKRSAFAGRAEWPFKFVVNGEIWVGAPAEARNREVVITDTATFNLLLQLPSERENEASQALRLHRERIERAWPGLGANLAVDAAQRHHFTVAPVPKGRSVLDLSPLRGIPLHSLHLGAARIADLSPLQDMTNLTTLTMSDPTYQALLMEVLAALPQADYPAATQGIARLLGPYARVPALAGARAMLEGGVANLRAIRTQPPSRPPFALQHNGSRFAWIPQPMTWDDARRLAETCRGHLATVTNDEENAWLVATFGVANLGRMIWLGGTDELVEGSWGWLDGSPWTFEHWTDPEPNNFGGGENALALKADAWWIDADGHQLKLPFVIEWKD